MQKLKIAILGYGHIGKKPADLVTQNEGCELVALIDPKFHSDNTCVSLPVQLFVTLQDFLESGVQVDIVAICTPNGLHYGQATLPFAHRIPLIIEKPISVNSEEAVMLEKLASDRKIHIFPVMQNRFSTPPCGSKALWMQRFWGKSI